MAGLMIIKGMMNVVLKGLLVLLMKVIMKVVRISIKASTIAVRSGSSFTTIVSLETLEVVIGEVVVVTIARVAVVAVRRVFPRSRLVFKQELWPP